MTRYAHVMENGLIDSISLDPVDGWVEVPDDTFGGDAYYEGAVIHSPGQYYVWSGTEFDLDQTQFTPFLLQEMANYRDVQAAVAVSFDDGTTTYNVTNDDRTRAALLQKVNSMQLNPDVTINFQTNDGFFDLGVLQIQGLFQACDTRQQKCFDAYQTFLTVETATPYTDEATAKSDFDATVAS